MTEWFPPLKGVHTVGWVGLAVLGTAMVALGSAKLVVAYGGFSIGFCLLWAWIRWRYESIEFRTAVEEVDA